MLCTHCPCRRTRLPATSLPVGVTLARAEGRVKFAVTGWNAESLCCTEIQWPERAGSSRLESPK